MSQFKVMQNVHVQIGHLLIHCSKNDRKLFLHKKEICFRLIYHWVFLFVCFLSHCQNAYFSLQHKKGSNTLAGLCSFK